MNLAKLLGISLFLLLLYVLLLIASPAARSWTNQIILAGRIGHYGIITLAAGMLIISGGIDLSIGSVIGLTATLLAIMLMDWHTPLWVAVPTVLVLGAVIGLINGVLVATLRAPAFIITLCFLFLYRGLAQYIADDTAKGLEDQFYAQSDFVNGAFLGVPMTLWIFLVLAVLATVFLHFSVYGRYLFAIGSNEQAARYSGVAVKRYRILAYVMCSLLTAFFGILFLFINRAARPSAAGEFRELYAIAGAVLGGCSLRGGEGTVAGIIVGTAILMILPNLANMWGVPSSLEFTVIGAALLIGTILEEIVRIARQRQLSRKTV